MTDEAVKTTFKRIIAWMTGEENQRIDDWLENDNESYCGVLKFVNECAASGWNSLDVSPFDYASNDTIKLAINLYKSANKFFGGDKG